MSTKKSKLSEFLNGQKSKPLEGLLKEERIKEVKSIKNRSRPLHELVFDIGFIVQSVLTSNEKHYINTERVIGRKNPLYPTGMSTYTTIEVLHYDEDNYSKDFEIVNLLTFSGDAYVFKGDTIRAKIPLYNEHIIEKRFLQDKGLTSLNQSSFEPGTLYLPRTPNRQEKAIEITIPTKNYTARSTDFNSYQKKH